jgi:hypothetical protein
VFIPEAYGTLDYAINGGEDFVDRQINPGPNTIAEAEAIDWCIDGLGNRTCDGEAFGPLYRSLLTGVLGEMNGVSFRRSEVGLRHVSDGASGTYLIGEKFIFTWQHGRSGSDLADGPPWCNGVNTANTRWGRYPPLMDVQADPMNNVRLAFGSTHPVGFHMAHCDGSVRIVAYDIDPLAHLAASNRHDGLVPGTAGGRRTQRN